MSFGFSISDILLTYKALERLMKTRNSCQEYQELSVFLHRCRNDIERYEALLPHIFSDPHPDIVGEINDFKELLDKHQESFRKYEKHLSRDGSGNALRKIQWGLRLSPKIKALKDDLDARIGRVNQRIETHRIAYQMVALQRVTRDLGNPWEGDLDRNNTPVALRNPFDHASLFPFLELSQSREAFIGAVQNVMFGDPTLPWSRAVAAGNFEIRDDADELLTADNWDERVRAGTSLRMFIILHLPIFPHCTPIGNFCPFCHYICDGWHRPVTEDSNGKQYWKPLFCPHCKSYFRTAFQRRIGPRVTVLDDEPQNSESTVDRQTLPVLTSLAEVNQFQHFRRLTRTLVFVETELSDWIRTTEQWTKSSPPSHVDILYIMEWVRYELPEESLREFVEVARGLTVGETNLAWVMGTIIRLFSGHDDLFQIFIQLAGLFGVNLMSQLMPPTMDSVPTDYFVNWIVEG